MKRLNHSYPNEGLLLSQRNAKQPDISERSPQAMSVTTAQVFAYTPRRTADLAS